MVVPKTVGSTTFCAYRNAIMLATYNNFFWGGHFMVYDLWLCTNVQIFTLCRQMALLQSIKFQTADFPIFCARILWCFSEQRVHIGKCILFW